MEISRLMITQLVATTNVLVKEDHSCTTKTLILSVTYSQHSIELSMCLHYAKDTSILKNSFTAC